MNPVPSPNQNLPTAEPENQSGALRDRVPCLVYRGRADRERTMEFAGPGCRALLGLEPNPSPAAALSSAI